MTISLPTLLPPPIRVGGVLLSTLALLAALLAVLGVYGIIVYTVGQRGPELAIRLSLGATPAAIRSLVLRRGIMILAAGILLGLVAAVALGLLLSAALYGVSPVDPIAMLGSAGALAMAALAAMHVPVLRAIRVPLSRTLRNDD